VVTGDASRWSDHDGVQRGADYDARWHHLEAAGHPIHGEADFVCRFGPASALDAGCGTGRVAIELARRGVDVVGVDLDPPMIEQARVKAPELAWVEGDLRTVDLGRRFDVVVMAGNVMIFVQPGSEAEVVANLARHAEPGGVVIAGFQLGQGYGIDRYDRDCLAVGLSLEARFATWDGDPWPADAAYAVSVHRA
jgi:SAM-dependent methyltransferase